MAVTALHLLTLLATLGLPVAALSWLMLRKLYRAGELDPTADRKATEAELKQLGKTTRKARLTAANLTKKKWFQFGGGFYGAAAIWTLVVVELSTLADLLQDFPDLSALAAQGLVSIAIAIGVNQLENFITAITWFLYWGQGSGVPLAFAAAYGGYALGLTAAKSWRPSWL